MPTGFTFSLTDIFLNNTGGDGGVVTLTKGTQTLFQWNASDFRTLDDHFVTGLRVTATEDMAHLVAVPAGPARDGRPAHLQHERPPVGHADEGEVGPPAR